MWNLKIFPTEGEPRDHSDILIFRGVPSTDGYSFYEYLDSSILAYEKTANDEVGKFIGGLACDYSNTLEFLPDGISVKGHPVQLKYPEKNIIYEMRSDREERWEMTVAQPAPTSE